MILVLGLFITLALWLVDKSGYMQFTFQELLYPIYGAIGITIFAFGNAIVHIYKLTGTDLTLLSDPLKWALRLGM